MKIPSFEHSRTALVLRLVASVAIVGAVAVGCGGVGPESAESTSEAVTVCGQNTVHGMDVSHYDGTIDWPTAKASGIDFAIVKATESTGYVDPTFATNWAGMKAAGVVRGAYHFFRANADPIQQANHVVATVGALEAGDLPIVIDLETADGQTGATIGANAVKFLDAVTAATGKTAMVYTSPGFITGTVGTPPAGLGKYILWVANWGVSCPNVPGPWSTWTFWQHSSTGTVPGVPAAAVDLNTFNGTLADLHNFGGAGADAGGGNDAGSKGDAAGAHDGGATGGDAGQGVDGSTSQPDSGGITQGGGGGGGAGGAGGAGGGGGNAANPGNGTSASAGCAMNGGAGGSASIPALALLGLIVVGARTRRRR